MSKYTADGVDAYRAWLGDFDHPSACDMLRELSHRLRQEEEENKRDPVTEPRPGDRIELDGGRVVVFIDPEPWAYSLAEWRRYSEFPGATIIRRREVQQ